MLGVGVIVLIGSLLGSTARWSLPLLDRLRLLLVVVVVDAARSSSDEDDDEDDDEDSGWLRMNESEAFLLEDLPVEEVVAKVVKSDASGEEGVEASYEQEKEGDEGDEVADGDSRTKPWCR
jgi:hypothetical protein